MFTYSLKQVQYELVYGFIFLFALWLFLTERGAEPDRYGDPGTRAHPDLGKKTGQDGEFRLHRYHQSGDCKKELLMS